VRLIEALQEKPGILKKCRFFRCEIMPKFPLETRREDQQHIDAMAFSRRGEVQKLCISHSTPDILKPEIPRHFQAWRGAETLHFPGDSGYVKARGGVELRRRHANPRGSIACRSTRRDARDCIPSSTSPDTQQVRGCTRIPGDSRV